MFDFFGPKKKVIDSRCRSCKMYQNGCPNNHEFNDCQQTHQPKYESKLTKGRIPKGKVCPFSHRCDVWKANLCNHKGKNHQSDFSCATARAFDMIARNGT